MSTQQTPLTYEGILEMFRETREQFRETREQFREIALQMKETDRKFEESARQLKETQREVGKLSSSIGRLVENMVKGKIIEKFQALGFDVTGCSPNKSFGIKELGFSGEVDLLLDDGPVGILIEVKTTLEPQDVLDHIDRLEKYRRYADVRIVGADKKHFIGAVAGATVREDAAKLARENGMYVIVQSGEAVEIVTPTEGFTAKKW